MNKPVKQLSHRAYEFGRFRVDTENCLLLRDGEVVPLKPKIFDTLLALLEGRGAVLGKDELMNRLWPDCFVEENNLTHNISLLRKVLSEGTDGAEYIETIPKRGYRFVAAVREVVRKDAAELLAPARAIKRYTVGRERERAELRAGFDAIVAGRGLLLGISGEPGIGKTTVVEEFLAELADRGQPCLIGRGRCSERLAGTEAYLPLLEALDSLLASADAEAVVALMKQVAPNWYLQVSPSPTERSSHEGSPGEQAAASQQRLKRELAAFVQEISRAQPLVLFFDDLHWADHSTIDLLAYLASRFEAMRLLIIVAYRQSDLLLASHPFLQLKPELQARGLCRETALEFLSKQEVERYIELEFPQHRLPAELPALIYAKTEGSPLFVADLLRYLRDRQVIAQEDGRWVLARSLPEIERDLPESVRGMIERKIAQLGEADRRLLIAASVQGYEFDSAVVSQVLKMDTAEVEERLETLERTYTFVGLVEEHEHPDRTLTTRYQFVHVLYQTALYGSLRATRKAALSREVAQALEGYYGKQLEHVANQVGVLWEAAREFGRASECFEMAARQASRVSATQEVVALARRGLAMLERLAESDERRDRELSLQIILGNALIGTKAWSSTELEQAYSRARELCKQLGGKSRLLPVLYGLTVTYGARGKWRQALELAQEFLKLAERERDLSVVIAHRVLGVILLYVGELEQARREIEHAVSIYSPTEHRPLAWVYGHEPGMAGNGMLAWTLWLLGYPDQAQARSREMLRLAREVSHAPSQTYALLTASLTYLFRREYQQARELVEAANLLATDQGSAYWLPLGKASLGRVMAEQGDVAAGIDEMRLVRDAFLSAGIEMRQPLLLCFLAEAYQKAGQPGEGLAALTEAEALIEKNEERIWESELYRLRGELLYMEGAAASVVQLCFERAIEIARRQKAKSLELRAVVSLARLWQEQGKAAEAHDMLAGIYGWFTEGFETADLKEAKALLCLK